MQDRERRAKKGDSECTYSFSFWCTDGRSHDSPLIALTSTIRGNTRLDVPCVNYARRPRVGYRLYRWPGPGLTNGGVIMSNDSNEQLSSSFRRLWWLPLAALLGIELYIRNFDGWGAWASAPLLLIPPMISFPIVMLGLYQCVAAMRAKESILPGFFYTLVSALPIFWLGVRRFFA